MTDQKGADGARLLALTLALIVAFAANFVPNRAALDGEHVGSPACATIRVASGAAILAVRAIRFAGWR